MLARLPAKSPTAWTQRRPAGARVPPAPVRVTWLEKARASLSPQPRTSNERGLSTRKSRQGVRQKEAVGRKRIPPPPPAAPCRHSPARRPAPLEEPADRIGPDRWLADGCGGLSQNILTLSVALSRGTERWSCRGGGGGHL